MLVKYFDVSHTHENAAPIYQVDSAAAPVKGDVVVVKKKQSGGPDSIEPYKVTAVQHIISQVYSATSVYHSIEVHIEKIEP